MVAVRHGASCKSSVKKKKKPTVRNTYFAAKKTMFFSNLVSGMIMSLLMALRYFPAMNFKASLVP